MYLKKHSKKRSPSAAVLEEYMKEHGFSRKQLAEKLQISESYLSHFLNGRRHFGGKTALRISRLTGIPVENLIV